MDRTINRDLFKVSSNCFMPRAAGAEPDVDDPGVLGAVADLIAARQRASDEELSRIRAIRKRAAGLSLRSVMTVKGKPTALINGQVLGRGDSIDGFRVEEIGPERCLVSHGGVTVELRMD
jgi:hypothetical protein